MHMAFDLADPLLGIYPKEVTSEARRDVCVRMRTKKAQEFVTVKT